MTPEEIRVKISQTLPKTLLFAFARVVYTEAIRDITNNNPGNDPRLTGLYLKILDISNSLDQRMERTFQEMIATLEAEGKARK